MNAEDIAAGLIALHENKELIGRTRLQKEAYLLHRCGANFDLPFTYHHYGPYSFELAEGTLYAQAEDRIEIEERVGRYGVRYAIFRAKENTQIPDHIGQLPSGEANRLLSKMEKVSDVVLEIAATIAFLCNERGYGDGAVDETKIRKPRKASNERVQEAQALLSELGLQPQSASAGSGG